MAQPPKKDTLIRSVSWSIGSDTYRVQCPGELFWSPFRIWQ